MPYRQSQWRTLITVLDTPPIILPAADKWEGGEKETETESYPRANGDVPLGGKASRADGTATYLYDETLHAVFKRLDIGAGLLKVEIHRAALGDDKTPMGGPANGYTLTGYLKSVSMPSGDYGSNDGAEVELGFALDAVLA